MTGAERHVVERRAHFGTRLAAVERAVNEPLPLIAEGRLVRMVGLTLEAVGCEVPVGGRCRIQGPEFASVEAEAVGFSGDRVYLMPVGPIGGITQNARVRPTQRTQSVPAGPALLGRVINAAGEPLDGGEPPVCTARVPLAGRPVNPLSRARVREVLDVGVRAVNGLLTLGRGQRMGLFAGSGVGKSMLLGMMTRYTSADIVVVGLIGERGREVNEFVREILGAEGMRRAVVVVSPADDPPLMRLQGAMAATAIAEHFRDQGRSVLLLMDSLTRFAQAQREISLAIGEPPATRGYTPSVFAKLPQLLERAGNGEEGGGSITGIYTVLTEGDETADPVADAARGVLDGHIVLSREIAERGRYPAIDVEASVSRVMTGLAGEEHLALARRFKRTCAVYRQHEDLINVGAYRPGSNPAVDEAVRLHPRLEAFLAQDAGTAETHSASIAALAEAFGPAADAAAGPAAARQAESAAAPAPGRPDGASE